jgi:hypothetical protein
VWRKRNQVRIFFNAGGGNGFAGFAAQVFGESFTGQLTPGQYFNVERNVVPCTYEVTGQMLDRRLQVGFGVARAGAARGEQFGGVDRGSIVVDEGPSPSIGTPGEGSGDCSVTLNQLVQSSQPPFAFRIRFRVIPTNSNVCGF